MRKDTHYVGQVEEVMAYLDGELSPDRAQVVVAHLQDCEECQGVILDLRGVSQEMKTWQVEAYDVSMSFELSAALEHPEAAAQAQPEGWWPGWLNRPHLGWKLAYGSAAAVITAVLGVAMWSTRSAPKPSYTSAPPQASRRLEQAVAVSPADTSKLTASMAGEDRDRLSVPAPATLESGSTRQALLAAKPDFSAQVNAGLPRVPMIVRTAQLTVIASDFDSARASLDEILKRHQGYVGEMSTAAPEQGERELTARLHIPAPQLDAALAEFKKLGRVEHESQSGEEVTSQFVDLEARLANARNSEQRLTDLLRNRTGKLEDVLQVEEKIGETREDIERMEAQRKSLLTSVDFATVNLTLRQERKAQLQMAPPSIGTRFHNAAVDGYTTLASGVIGLLELLLSIGPSLLLWGALVFFPARWAWRRRHQASS